MGFDPRTLFLVHGITGLALGGMFFAFWRAHRAMSCLALWAGGVTLLGAGTLLVSLHDLVPDFIPIIIGHILSLSGTIIVWNGIRVFNGRQPDWRLLAALPLFAVSLGYWTYIDNELAIRIAIVAGSLAITSFMCADELLRRGRRPLPPMAILAGAPLALDGIVLVGRVLSALLHPPTSGAMAAGGSILWVPLIGRILTSFGFVVMTAERYIEQRRELEAQLFQSQKMEALGTLAGGIAHDLNNVLVPILALSKMTATRLANGSRERTNLETILQSGERARDLVRQILAFSRKEAPTLQGVDIAQITRDSLRLLRASVPPNIKIAETIATVPLLWGDIGKLHQVIANLVINAAQAIGDRNGTIIVECATAPGEQLPLELRSTLGSALRLTVHDNGCGMDQATVARMFDPFFTTKSAGAGTGLGLSVVHGIIEQHGGRILVESNIGQGTRVDIYLPATQRTVSYRSGAPPQARRSVGLDFRI
jgi:signal transduction histidine kinase